jgi:ABC-type molybdate transport system substrate-binding protein
MRRRKTNISVAVITVLCALVIVGCSKDEAKVEHRELVVLCGSSFVLPAEKMCSEFTASAGIAVVTTVAGSEDFLPLIKAGQEGDILITHDPYLDYVRDAGVLADHAQVGFVAPVLAVQKGNPLEKKGIKDAVMKNVENRLTKGHSNLGNLLKTKAVDAVIMWNGVAHIFGDGLEIVPTQYEYDKEVRVHVISLNYSGQPQLLRKFIKFVRNRGPAIFAEYGYVK